MRLTSLDTIITGLLMQRRYPIHFYVEFLIYAKRAMDELHFDVLGNVRTQALPVNSYGAVTLPCDYMDFVSVGVPVGQFVQPLAQRTAINRLNNFDATGNKIPYANNVCNYGTPGTGYTVRMNDHYEFTGRMYGYQGNQNNTFMIFKERNEIQLNNNCSASTLIVEYISDGSECDNATKISPYAIATIESYILWKMKENARSYGEGERMRAQRQYEFERAKLKGRLNPFTITDLKAILNKSTHNFK